MFPDSFNRISRRSLGSISIPAELDDDAGGNLVRVMRAAPDDYDDDDLSSSELFSSPSSSYFFYPAWSNKGAQGHPLSADGWWPGQQDKRLKPPARATSMGKRAQEEVIVLH